MSNVLMDKGLTQGDRVSDILCGAAILAYGIDF